MRVYQPAGDVCPVLDWVYVIPTSTVFKRGSTAVSEETETVVEMWANPLTGQLEPFVAVYPDEDGRWPIVSARVTIVEEVLEREEKRRFPDWGGQVGNMDVVVDIPEQAAWAGAGLVAFGLLWLMLALLRGR